MSATSESKRERRLAARAERQRLAEEGRRKARQRRRLAVGALVILAVGLLAGGLYLIIQRVIEPSAPGVSVPLERAGHVSPGEALQHNSNPPSSGLHYSTWTRPGVYTEPQDMGYWVHSLEH